MSSPETISPRGIPPIRPDWLVDVAWRLADLGLDHLRSWSEAGQYVLEDHVDGGRWRFESVRLTHAFETRVEHEADLHIPTDTGTPTLRAAFAFTPWWDEVRGRCIQARVEIGPRGPVTFDPENWFVLLPLPESGEARPAIAGVEEGSWTYGGDVERPTAPVDPQVLVGQSLAIDDLALVADPDKAIPEVLLRAFVLVHKRGLLGRSREVPADLPGHAVAIRADGPLEASWTGNVSLDDLVEGGRLVAGAVEVTPETVSLRSASGVLTLSGPGIRLVVTPTDAP